MRYKIINGQVVESMFINAPYDSRKDAEEAKNEGTIHNCEHTEIALTNKAETEKLECSCGFKIEF